MVGGEGLEPSWVTPPAPKAGASASFAIRPVGWNRNDSQTNEK